MASRNQAIEKYNAGKHQTALNIAKNFKMGVTEEERNQMALGYECMAHGETYAQMGYDCVAEIQKALDVLTSVLGINNTNEEEDTMAENTINTIEEVAEEEIIETAEPTETVEIDEVAEPEETADEEELSWIYISSKRDKKVYAEVTYAADIDDFVRRRRAEGYHFVALMSKPKLTGFLDGNPKGMKCVCANLAKKGIDNFEQFLRYATQQATAAYDEDKLVNAVEVL